jgi:ribonucleotide reductase beta subunit family protein with ferritin-like domain
MDDSIGSADENNHPHATNLFSEINTNNWQPEDLSFSLDRSRNESLNESRGNISFDNT